MRKYLYGLALFVACAAAFLLSPANKTAQAGSPNNIYQLSVIDMAPIYTTPDTYAGSVGGTPSVGIADPSVTVESATQRLIITNKHATNDLCVFWVATGATCGTAKTCDGTGTDNGDLILGRSAVAKRIAGDLRTCVVASATDTTFHISRSKVE
jgi:hypothetical protein